MLVEINEVMKMFVRAVQRTAPNARIEIVIDNPNFMDVAKISGLTEYEYDSLLKSEEIEFYCKLYREKAGGRWEFFMKRIEEC